MTQTADDALLECLLALCRYHGNASTPQALTSGLPLRDGRLTPDLFKRAATRAGLSSRITYQQARDLPPALLPAVLLLEDQGACLLMGWDDSGKTARVVYPQFNESVVEVPTEELLNSTAGTAIICRPRFRFDQRVPRTQAARQGHWFWSAIKANMPIYKDVLLAAFFINLFALAFPLFIRIVYDRVIPNHALETLWMLTAGIAIIMLADVVLRTLRAYFLDLASRRVDVQLSGQIMEQVLGIRLENKPNSVGTYASHLRSFETLRDFITSSTITTVIDLPFAILFMLVIGLIAWQMLIPLLIGVAVTLLYALFAQKKLRELSETTYRAGAQRNSILIEGLVGLDTIKAMGAESRIQRKWEDTTSFLAQAGVKLRIVSNSTINVTRWAQQMVKLFVIVTGVYLISAGQLTMGGLIACHLLASRAMGPFGQVAGLLLQYHNAALSLKNLNGIMTTPVERPEGAQFLSREMFRGDIELKNVSFSYPGSDIAALSNISFKLKAGEHVAILGRVGSGKSTVQKLCMGLYQPTDGAILIDGIDLRQLDPSEFRSRVGYVPQDVTLFFGSLRENLTLSHVEASDSALIKAAKIAGLLEYINRHPKGIDMPIGERGESLSGGQRKSVALARALTHEPSILLLDEPTGSMDNSTEKTVKRRLERYIAGRTLLMVTHRNSLLSMVDRIIVLDNGKLVADGARDQVIEALQQGKIGKVR